MPLPADDILAVQKVLVDYSHAIDTGDADAFAALFVEDCMLEVGLEKPITSHDGLRELANMMKNYSAGLRHVVSTISIDGDGDSATGRAYVEVFATAGGPEATTLTASGIVRATFRKEGGTWRHVTRTVDRDG